MLKDAKIFVAEFDKKEARKDPEFMRDLKKFIAISTGKSKIKKFQ